MIPVNEPIMGYKEKQMLNRCIDSGWISSEGPFVEQFEDAVAHRVGRMHGIAVCNGSAALDLAVVALNIGKDDEVIMPTFTIISCAASVVRAGATPVLVDCDPKTWNTDVSQIEAKITEKTRAIMAVHIYGLPVDMLPVLALAKKYNLKVIEDASEALGQEYRGRPCGSMGDISTFSFYPNKLVTTGEGGLLVTDDIRLADRCRSLRNLCFEKQRRFVHRELGWNYRMTNLQAAVGLAQLERLDEFIAKKRNMGRRYTDLLSDIGSLELPAPATDYAENIYWVFGLVLKEDCTLDRDAICQGLYQYEIGTRPFFWPMHQQPVFEKMGLFAGETYPVAERISRRGFYLPSGLNITDNQIDTVCRELRQVVR